ncbi:hypothetical protein J6590_079046, partial [Homalodisca vitripennis]
ESTIKSFLPKMDLCCFSNDPFGADVYVQHRTAAHDVATSHNCGLARHGGYYRPV